MLAHWIRPPSWDSDLTVPGSIQLPSGRLGAESRTQQVHAEEPIYSGTLKNFWPEKGFGFLEANMSGGGDVEPPTGDVHAWGVGT